MSRGVTLRLASQHKLHPSSGAVRHALRLKPVPLRWHLAGLCVGVMFPVLVLLGYIFWHAAMDEREAMEAAGQRSASTISANVERDLTALTAAMQALSNSQGIQDGNLWRFHSTASRLSVMKEPNAAVVLTDLNGQQLLNTRLPFGSPLPVSNPETIEGLAEVVETEKPRVSPVFVGTTAKEPIFTISVPVFKSGTEDVTHVLHLSLPVKRIRSIITSTLPGEHEIGTVSDKNHRIVARNVGHEDFVTKTSNMVAEAVMDGEGHIYAVTNGGTTVRVFQSPVQGTTWTVSVGIPDERLNAPYLQFVLVIGLAALGMLLVSFLIATVIGRGATRALSALVAGAEALGRNEVVDPVETHIKEVNAVLLSLARASEDLRGAHERHDLLINELNHRVKNTLATVQSMAAQTARHHAGPGEFMPRFEARLLGLSASHNLLTRTGWEGADLWDIVQVELVPICGEDSSRWKAEGPLLRLKSEPTVALGMALHELATNALKYGALSNEKGRVSLRWGFVGDEIEIVWKETGGPSVMPPTRRGFGSRLIPSVVRQLDGTLFMEYAETGVVCTITFKKDVLS